MSPGENTILTSTVTELESIRLLGLRVNRVDMAGALRAIEAFIAGRQPRHVVTADASMVVLARENPELRSIIEAADRITPDGTGILWVSRLLKRPITSKVSGVDLVEELCRLSAGKGYRLFFLGAAPGVAEAAAGHLRAKYPGAQIVGTRHGFFQPEEEPEIVGQIASLCPDVLFVAFGIPKQEKFIARHEAALGVPVSVGIGGSFDVHSGHVRRAPKWMQNAGLEWAFRLSQNPKKISKVMTLPRFVALALKARFLGK